ncbi:MAG: HAD family hydrolase [Acidimicrobiales bacterium]|nr:HAD family hydrolase [Acidimicrobiales bacterium]
MPLLSAFDGRVPFPGQWRAVTFDLWNTLLVSVPGAVEVRLAAWRQVVDERGLDLSADLLRSVVELFPARFEDEWRAGRQYGTSQALDDAFRAFAGRIGPADETALSEAFEAASYHLEVGAVEGGAATLATLAAAGIPIGLVSDTSLAGGRHLRGYLEDHGLLDHIDHCSFSDEVGVYKPDAKIFRDCLAGLGIDDPTGVVHVGDLRRTDVAGAWKLGMTTVRFRGVVDDADRSEGSEAHHVIDRLTDLPALLGVAGG